MEVDACWTGEIAANTANVRCDGLSAARDGLLVVRDPFPPFPRLSRCCQASPRRTAGRTGTVSRIVHSRREKFTSKTRASRGRSLFDNVFRPDIQLLPDEIILFSLVLSTILQHLHYSSGSSSNHHDSGRSLQGPSPPSRSSLMCGSSY